MYRLIHSPETAGTLRALIKLDLVSKGNYAWMGQYRPNWHWFLSAAPYAWTQEQLTSCFFFFFLANVVNPTQSLS